MKKLKDRCGAALLEIMVSIAMLGLLLVPISSGILMSLRMNQRSDEIMKARLAVSSAVETIMAVGVDSTDTPSDLNNLNLEGIREFEWQDIAANSGWMEITVTSDSVEEISVKLTVRDNSLRGDISQGGGA